MFLLLLAIVKNTEGMEIKSAILVKQVDKFFLIIKVLESGLRVREFYHRYELYEKNGVRVGRHLEELYQVKFNEQKVTTFLDSDSSPPVEYAFIELIDPKVCNFNDDLELFK